MKLNWTEAKTMMHVTKPTTSGSLSSGFSLLLSLLFLAASSARYSPSSLAILYSVKMQGKKTNTLMMAKMTDSQAGPVYMSKYNCDSPSSGMMEPKGANAA